MTPRGIRNHNPGNIVANGIEWRGLASRAEMTAEQKAETRFAVFKSPEFGIRAMVLILQTYRRRGDDSVAKIISKWAPSSDGNDVDAYSAAVASGMNVDANATIDTSDPQILLALIKEIIAFENGQQPYPDDVIMAGIGNALNRRPTASKKSETIKGQVRHGLTFASGLAAAVALGLLTQGEADTLSTAADTLLTEENIEAISGALAVLAGLIGAVWSAMAKKET